MPIDENPLALAEAALDHVQVEAAVAVTLAERALGLARACGSVEAEVAALHALSYAMHELGDPAAVSTIRAAIRIADRTGQARRGSLARRRLAMVLASRGSTTAALAELDAASAGFDDRELARTQVFRIAILSMAGLPAPPRGATNRAIATLHEAGDLTWEARLLHNRGTMSAQRGDTAQAEADLLDATRLYHSLGAHEAAVAAELQLVRVLRSRGELPACLAALDSIDHAEISPAAVAERELLRAQVLAAARLMDDALTSLHRAQAFWDRSAADDHEGRLEILRLTLLAGDASGGRTLARRMRARFAARHAEIHRAHVVGLGLRASIALGDVHARELPAAEAAAQTLRAAGWREDSLGVRLAIARAATMLGRAGVAAEQLAACRSLRRRGPVADRIEWWHVQALSRLAAGDRTGALAAARTGLALLERHRASLGATDMRVSASAIGAELARLGLSIALTDGPTARALRWAERLRASALRLDPVRPPGDPALRDARTELRRVTAGIHRAQRSGQTAAALLERQAELELTVRRRSRHSRGTAAPGAAAGAPDGPATAPARTPAGPPGRPQLAAALVDRALVELIEHDGSLTALTLVDGRLSRSELGPLQPVADEQEWLRFALTRLARIGHNAPQRPALQAGAQASAETLSRLLIAPLAGRIADRELILVPTGPLHALPWALLPDLEGRTLTVAPSAAIWLQWSVEPEPVGAAGGEPSLRDRVVLVAGPGLRHGRAELNAIGRLYPYAETLSGRAATVAAVLAAVDGAAVAHLACHGRFRADSPLFSSLELADGPLNAYELQSLRRAPELVVLSACDLAVSDIHPGDELLGFASALLNMGTRTVIASSVPVPDATTKRLMTGLHERLVAGASPAAALADAQRRMIGAQPALGGFVCLGAG